VQINVDATTAMQAGIGAGYIRQILDKHIARYAARSDEVTGEPVTLVTHVAFNPGVVTSWFNGIMGLVSNVTMLAIILASAAVVREREPGTMRGAGVDVVWPQFFAVFGIAVLFFALALRCFRRSTAASTA
jgi:ABC-2 type transport system permease protein